MAGAGVELFLWLALCGVMAWSMVRRPAQSFFRPVLLAYVPLVIMLLPMLASDQWMSGPEMESLRQSWTEAMEAYPAPEGVDSETFRELLERQLEWAIFLMPGSLAVFWLGLLTASAWVIRRVLASKKKAVPAPPLMLFKAPEWLVWVFLLPALVVLASLNGWMEDPDQNTLRVSGNILLGVSGIYVFQGIQVLRWRVTRAKSSWVIWLVLAVTFLILGAAALISLGLTLTMIGILDLWLDFRRLAPPEDGRDDHGGRQ